MSIQPSCFMLCYWVLRVGAKLPLQASSKLNADLHMYWSTGVCVGVLPYPFLPRKSDAEENK